ncbi:MAG: polysaccharide deacetylase family protein [Pseudolabrys sp.]
MTLTRHDRYPYQPITQRPDFSWPDGRRLALYVAINVETFHFGKGLGAKLAPAAGEPDVLNYAWRDYGNRVGVFRMIELFDALAWSTSVLVNSAIYDEAPAIMDAFRARSAEVVGHGRTNSERQGNLDETAEKALIADATTTVAAHEGAPPAGWLGPWISQSNVTPDLLKEAGYQYLLDWCHDDRPIWFKTRAGPILSVPYPQEVNDIPMIVGRQLDGAAFADMIVDDFEERLAQSEHQPIVMGIALHPYLVGQPYRLRHLRRALEHIAKHAGDSVWITTAGAIARHFAECVPPP